MKQFIGNNMSCMETDVCNRNDRMDGPESHCGRLCLIQKHKGRTLRVHVFVRVYRSSFEHYAVLYKDNKYSTQAGFINLKNCAINRCSSKDNQIQVTVNDMEGTSIVFESNTLNEAEQWVEALQPHIYSLSPQKGSISPRLSPVIPRSPLMPTLAEETDEEE